MNRILKILPEIEMEEAVYVDSLLKEKTDEQVASFAGVYRARRKEPMLILATALIGLVFFAGIHRFLLNQIGMGILYLFTGGLCVIGTIVDLVNYKNLTLQYNQQVANEVAAAV